MSFCVHICICAYMLTNASVQMLLHMSGAGQCLTMKSVSVNFHLISRKKVSPWQVRIKCSKCISDLCKMRQSPSRPEAHSILNIIGANQKATDISVWLQRQELWKFPVWPASPSVQDYSDKPLCWLPHECWGPRLRSAMLAQQVNEPLSHLLSFCFTTLVVIHNHFAYICVCESAHGTAPLWQIESQSMESVPASNVTWDWTLVTVLWGEQLHQLNHFAAYLPKLCPDPQCHHRPCQWSYLQTHSCRFLESERQRPKIQQRPETGICGHVSPSP